MGFYPGSSNMNITNLVAFLLLAAVADGKAHIGVHQLSPIYYQQHPLAYHPDNLGVFRYPARGCVGFLGCIVQGINATNQGFITGAHGILQGGVAAGSGIATGVGAAVGGVASGIGTGVGGVASGIGEGIGGVASGTGAAVGGVASGTGAAVGGVASGTGQAVGGAVPQPKKRVCVRTGPFSYYCYYVNV